MNLCIFCDTELTPETKPEHILLNALGGRKTTRRAICSSHNNKFGATIDKAITDQVAAFRNLLKLDSGTGKPPPLMRIENTRGERLILHPDGKPDLVQKPFVFTPRPEGGFDIEINARDEAELTRIIPNVAAALGASESSVWDQLAQNGTGSWRSRRAGTVHHELALGGEDSLRSICKAAFCLIAADVGTDSLRTPAFASARDFVVSGGDEFNRERGSLDPRTLPVSDLLEERFGPLFNLIYVRSDPAGRVVAHFTLYNLIAWRAVLAEAGGPTDLHLALASNPLEPGQWSDRILPGAEVPFAWLDAPDRSNVFEATTARFTKALSLWQERGRSELTAHIVNRIFERHGITDDQSPIDDPELTQRIVAEIADELAHHLVGLPHQRPMSPDDLNRLRGERKP
ncbi:MAG: HNH endonuclease [Brevundimonas sp.]|uniref:HNH endonuclease n=1 Tax=Brevundimonas sp. TaxID=1871086 RepID=UPI0024896391|nr:HNH endonuclease [Brevundimonas sp.]MDI1328150.1 HNH endonuclease [Brevundimonas sp.]